MKVNVWRRVGALGVLCALASTMLTAAPAHAAIATVFNLNGTYDVGGPARPVISNVNDALTVDMSAFGRANGFGTVIATDLIQVTFPGDATYGAVLVAPGTIRWSNGTEWRRMPRVPGVIGFTEPAARQTLGAAGFVVFVSGRPPALRCSDVGKVKLQSPVAGTAALQGSVVSIQIWKTPIDGCEIS